MTLSMIKIACVVPVWNEINYIHHKVNWCRNNLIDLYVINNESTDGTKEYLVENRIPHHDLDTGGTFDLLAIHQEILKTAKRLKPDWLMFLGCDLFAQTHATVREMIESAQGNTIYLPTYNMCDTGEERGNPFHTYFYAGKYIDLPLIVKWDKRVTLRGDAFTHPASLPVTGNGILVNYGMTKPKKEREETLQRRKKAWQKGLRETLGKHYLKAEARNWIWSKESLVDMRTLHPELIQKLQEQVLDKRPMAHGATTHA